MFFVITNTNRIATFPTVEAAQFNADLVTEAGFAQWALVTDAQGDKLTRHTAKSVTIARR